VAKAGEEVLSFSLSLALSLRLSLSLSLCVCVCVCVLGNIDLLDLQYAFKTTISYAIILEIRT
jgi:hypothetical protein